MPPRVAVLSATRARCGFLNFSEKPNVADPRVNETSKYDEISTMKQGPLTLLYGLCSRGIQRRERVDPSFTARGTGRLGESLMNALLLFLSKSTSIVLVGSSNSVGLAAHPATVLTYFIATPPDRGCHCNLS